MNTWQTVRQTEIEETTKLLQTLKQRPEPEIRKANEHNEQTYYNVI